MKKIFISIGLAALMLVSGTNVYLANQTNESAQLNLLDIEYTAEGESQVIPPAVIAAGIIKTASDLATIGAFAYIVYDHFKSDLGGWLLVYSNTNIGNDGKEHGTKYYECLASGSECKVGHGSKSVTF